MVACCQEQESRCLILVFFFNRIRKIKRQNAALNDSMTLNQYESIDWFREILEERWFPIVIIDYKFSLKPIH